MIILNNHFLLIVFGFPHVAQPLEDIAEEDEQLEEEEDADIGEEDEMADFIVDEVSVAPDSVVTQENLFVDIKKMLSVLSPKERDVLIMRFGIDNNGVHKTLDEIGNQYGVSRERVRQIENRAIAKLKKYCKNKELTPDLKNYFGG